MMEEREQRKGGRRRREARRKVLFWTPKAADQGSIGSAPAPLSPEGPEGERWPAQTNRRGRKGSALARPQGQPSLATEGAD